MKLFLNVVLVLIHACCSAQEDNRRTKLSVSIGVGRSVFISSLPSPSKFPTLELRTGAGVIIPIRGLFDFRTGLTFGVKMKREAFNKPGQIYYIGPPFYDLDDAVGARSHFFYEIPIILQANLPHPKLTIGAGGVYRYFISNNGRDFMGGRRELGLIISPSYRLSERIILGVEYYFGLTKIYNSQSMIDSMDVMMHIRNQYAQVVIRIAR